MALRRIWHHSGVKTVGNVCAAMEAHWVGAECNKWEDIKLRITRSIPCGNLYVDDASGPQSGTKLLVTPADMMKSLMSISLPSRSHATIPQPKQRDSHSGQLADDHKAAQVSRDKALGHPSRRNSKLNVHIPPEPIPDNHSIMVERTGNGRDNPIRQVICLS